MHTLPFAVPVGTAPEKIRELLRADIERRLKGACSEWSEADFQKLVDDATDIEMKYVPEAAHEEAKF